MNLDPRIIEAAHEVRKWAERRAQRRDEDHTHLTCYCAIASVRLSQRLNAMGIKHKLAMADSPMGNHVFLLVNNWIVDVTATQFDAGLAAVCVLNNHQPQKRWYHVVSRTYDDPHELVEFQYITGWPRDQIITKRELVR